MTKTCCDIVNDRPCGRTASKFNAESGVPFCDEHGAENPTYSSAMAELVTVGKWLATLQPAIICFAPSHRAFREDMKEG